MGDYKPSEDMAQYFDLIGHRYKRSNLVRVSPFVGAFLSRMSTKLRCHGLKQLYELREKLPESKKPIYIHVGRHLSELDWLEGQYLLHKQEMPAMIAMGSNLDVGGLGKFCRAMGAFITIRDNMTINGIEIAKKHAGKIMNSYLHHLIINEGRDILVYPEYQTVESEGQRKVKYGRSYSGELADFTPLIFRTVKNVQEHTDRPIMIVPHNPSRERVIEDEIFQALTEMKEKGARGRKVVMKDFGFILQHWLYQSNGEVHFNFGKPIPVADYKTRELTDKARTEVAKLQTMFPTHMFAYVMGDNMEADAINLGDRILTANHEFMKLGVHIHTWNHRDSFWRAYHQFHQSFLGIPTRRVVSMDKGMVRVERPDVLHQYRDNARSIEDIITGKVPKKKVKSDVFDPNKVNVFSKVV